MPPSPFDIFLDNLRKDLEKSARDLLKDLNKEAQRNIRGMGRAVQDATRPLPRPKKRATGGRKPVDRPETPHLPRLVLYDVLECSPKASPETISAAFRSLSSRYHPDNRKTGNAERYKDITAAWSVLKDPGKRKRYDRENGLV
jgi:DnaJ-domain-containing protein 1